MSSNPFALKIASPYARALFDYTLKENVMHKVTLDMHDLISLLNQSEDLTEYLNNPIISVEKKEEILKKILKSRLNEETFKFLMVLIKRERISIFEDIANTYLELVYQLASIKTIEISTTCAFTYKQKNKLMENCCQDIIPHIHSHFKFMSYIAKCHKIINLPSFISSINMI